MTNNDILRRLRYAFDFSNQQATELFGLDPSTKVAMSVEAFKARLEKEEDPGFAPCSDAELSAFLDGLIVARRGLRKPQVAAVETATSQSAEPRRLSRNDILKKLRIAMNFREQEMLTTLESGGSKLSKAELGALFR
ncbi:MAG: DUF1456 family protein, partial [Gammaproteobacteria bacterium]|nr:DUF1456 family protein [Gammaproteobacteria bacterium]